MKVRIQPSFPKGVTIHIPPSKSVAHRAIICACLASGQSVIHNIDYSDDMKATLAAMENLGAQITRHENSITVTGASFPFKLNKTVIDCHESGSTLRFLIPLFSLSNEVISFVGSKRLLERPQSIYQTLFNEQALFFKHEVDQIRVKGSLKANHYVLDGNVSSQFITGLLFALPLLNEDSTLRINEPFESRSYVDLTLQTLHDFGIDISYTQTNTLFIKGNQSYKNREYTIEGDYSQFAFFATLAAIKGTLSCTGLRHDSLQGDKEIIDILKRMGADIQEIKDGYTITSSSLKATTIDLSNCPDLGPICCVLGMYAIGETHIINASRLRIKESDRIEAMETELSKFEVDITSTHDEIRITGKQEFNCSDSLESHNDHRIVMSCAVAAAHVQSTIDIRQAEAIHKSYPAFFEDLKKAGIKVEVIENE